MFHMRVIYADVKLQQATPSASQTSNKKTFQEDSRA